jgi:hypothetical protein
MSEIESVTNNEHTSTAVIISLLIFAFNTYFTIKKTFLVLYAQDELKEINDKLENLCYNLDKKLTTALTEIDYLKNNMNNIIKYNNNNYFNNKDFENK